MSYGLQAMKLIIGLLTLALTLRLLGKQNLSQLTPYDVVYIVVFGGILDSTFYDDEIGIIPFIFSIIVWSLGVYFIELLVSRFSIFRVFFRGVPNHIIDDGKLDLKLFHQNNIEMEQLRIILRKNGIFSLKEVKDLYIEPDGSFSIIRYMQYQPVTHENLDIMAREEKTNILLIDEGEIEKKALKYIGKTPQWLIEEMNKLGVEDLSTIIYCEWSQEEGFYYKTDEDCIKNNRKGYKN